MRQVSIHKEVHTMLGNKVGEASGKITGLRVLPPDAQGIKVEVSFQGAGTILGMPMTDSATYCQTIRPGGALYGEGRVLFMTGEGDVALWVGFGVGAPTGPSPASKLAVCGSFQIATGKLAPLAAVAVVSEFEVHEDGTYQYETWEWK
jgi:hypothetical protein